MHEGDIYFWRYLDEDGRGGVGPYGCYHCWSQKAVFRDGRLFDTYWGDSSKVVNPDVVELTLKGNLADLTEISHYQAEFYNPRDIVDMRHANNSRGPVYRRNGASRCVKTIRDHLDGKISEAQSEIRMAQSRLDHYANQAEKIARGEIDEVCF
jgi:hypothetical protein